MSKDNKETHRPKFIRLAITDADGKEWGELTGDAKEFSSGASGFYAHGKVRNPESGASYQVGASIVLIGSKPAKK